MFMLTKFYLATKITLLTRILNIIQIFFSYEKGHFSLELSCQSELSTAIKRTLFAISLLFFFETFIYFTGKADVQRGGETERKILHLMIHSPSDCNDKCCANLKLGARCSSRSPTQVQDPKALGCPQLLFQATSTELDGKCGW